MSWPYYDEPDPEDTDYAAPGHASDHDGRIGLGEVRNAKGRPAGRRNRISIIRKVALAKYPVIEKGRRSRRTAVEVILLMIRAKAAKGDAAAIRLFDGLQQRFSIREKMPPRVVGISPEKLTMEEFDEQIARWRQKEDDT